MLLNEANPLLKDASGVFVCFVNGKKVEDSDIDPECSLLYYLRYKLLLTGTKLACGEGGCGACTVMISNYSHRLKKLKHYSVNACLMPLASVHGMAVTTVEGIGSMKNGLHVVQERIAKAHGSQCGFCTPGMVMSMYALLRNNPSPSSDEMQEYLTGNLCRCTGYRPILDGFGSFVSTGQQGKGCGKTNCCQLNKSEEGPDKPVMNGWGHNTEESSELQNGVLDDGHLFDHKGLRPYDPTQEIIFPPDLKINDQLESQLLRFSGSRVTYWRPTNLHDLIYLKHHNPQSKIIVGNTEVGVEVTFKDQLYPILINGSQVPEMTLVKVHDSALQVGASLNLTDLQVILNDIVNTRPVSETRSMDAMLEMLQWFAGRQIRNVASIGGNIMTGSPISDLNPILIAVGATLIFSSLEGGERTLPMNERFFTGYRRNAALPQEVLISVQIPFTQKDEFIKTFKQSRRRDDDIAIVNAAMKVKFHPRSNVVSSLVLALGGMAATTILAEHTMKELINLPWDESLLEKGISLLSQELALPDSAPGGMVRYRETLALSFFFKFYLSTRSWLSVELPGITPPLKQDEQLATEKFKTEPATGSQVFQQTNNASENPVGRPIIHQSAFKQTTGEALYLDDIPLHPNDLHAGFVLSKRAHSKIKGIDPAKALAVDGVGGFFCAQDLTENENISGLIADDEEVFRRDTTQCIGQVVGIIVAKDQATAKRAAKLVQVEYEDLPKPIITIEDAIESKSWWGPWTVQKGNLDKGFSEAAHLLEGEMFVGGQEHFYLEPNAHIAIPKGESGEMEVITTAQNLAYFQRQVSRSLGIAANKVVVKVKRLGGGFGGKENRPTSFCIPIAVAASKLGRTVRATVDRHEDMAVTGGRHPFLCRWKVGVTAQGDLTALKVALYANSGCSLDLSEAVVNKAMFSIDNAYRFPNIEVTGYACKTNLPSNTAFRGFGNPQSIMFIEDIMSRLAVHSGMDPLMLRERNLYRTGDITHIRMPMENCNIQRCWNEVIRKAQMDKRLDDIQNFNRTNRYRKRGMAICPLNYGIGSLSYLNQGGALVHIYTDGSVLLTLGGIEMGQGLHTKMIQVASRVMRIPVEEIYISETSTDKVPNAPPTAASICSDIYGMAVMRACQELMDRLEPFRKIDPKATMKDLAFVAYTNKVSLSCIGHYGTDCITGFDFKTQQGRQYNYYSQGTAVTEVEIDTLTGDHVILRTDIVMDIGQSLNPAIDIGQIEGAFMQGVGLVTLEELLYTPEGELITKGPGAYKIPGFQDIPGELNVSLLQDAPNPRAVYSSKAVGEPPLLLATSVFQALKSAIGAARMDLGLGTLFRLDSPATAERIRMACQDALVERVVSSNSQKNS